MSERFHLVTSAPTATDADAAAELALGLTSKPKRISCQWFYDAAGSKLFERICALEEYYPTRAEAEILEAHAARIVELVGTDVTVVELGSGSAVKTDLLIDAFLREAPELTYVPVDLSPSAIEGSAQRLLDAHAGLTVIGLAAEYRFGLEWLAANTQREHLVLWLGSNIGNFERPAAVEFLRDVRRNLSPQGHLLLGVDLRKDRRVLEAAYDDPSGVTARFNLNALAHINRELGADFDLTAFAHVARYDEQLGRVTMHLRSLRPQRVHIAKLDLDIGFANDERIHTEDSFKYSPAEIDELATKSGFDVVERWTDSGERFALTLLKAAP